MSLPSGSRLASYEIVAALGAGAMGEVYRARDTRLARDVALKVLPAEFAASPDRRRRFEQEARAAGALNHPNIVSVYDTGQQQGVSYIVSELVEGESLRDLIRHGPLPPRKAADIGAQIADGLTAAHRAGIVHRDLKPENVMLTREGRVKILDFGLARYSGNTQIEGTLTITQPGIVMGTVGYMSPEQVTGSPADHRSDIFSLGIMLFEMLTGRTAFDRATSVETMSAILREDPLELPAHIVPALRQIVAHCLEKEPAARFQSAQDLAFQLRAAVAPASVVTTTPLPPANQPPRLAIAAWALVGLLALLLGLSLFHRPRGADLAAYRFTPFATDAQIQDQATWSPDGKSIAYERFLVGATNQIMVRSLASLVPVQVARADANSLLWSPDASRLYYVTDSGLWSVSRAGGDPFEVIKGDFLDATLSPDGKAMVLWSRAVTKGVEPKIWISSPPGAALRKYEPAVFNEEGSFAPVYLRFAPDGRKIVLSLPSSSGSQVWLLPFPDGAGASFKPHRIFQAELRTEWAPAASWMPDSRHIVISFGQGQPQLWMADVESDRMTPLTAGESIKGHPSVSPDGATIAYTLANQNYDTVEIPVDGGAVRNLVATSRNESFPAWSPVGSQLAYITDRNGPPEIWVRNSQDGSDRPVVTARDFPDDPTLSLWTLAFSPDGRRLAYTRNSPKHLGAIWISPVDGGSPVRVTRSNETEFGPTWSPDGNWLVFFSTAQAGGLVKARVGSEDAPVPLGKDLCRSPAQWSPDGRLIACALNGGGVALLTPGGHLERKVGSKPVYVTWSRDSRELYALHEQGGGHWFLDAIDASTGAERTVNDLGSDRLFSSTNGNSFPLSLSPDGKSVATSVLLVRSDIWLLSGFPQPHGWLRRLWDGR